MSSNLYAEPVERKRTSFGTSLKWALRKALNKPVNAEIDKTFIPMIKGMICANKELEDDANILIDMIERYGRVSLKEEY